MAIRVLIVDDSLFICHRIEEILEQNNEFKVVGIANNGHEAIKMTVLLEPDIITMDVEMPMMDGITAVREIMAKCPTPVLMLSASTQIGAKATWEALNAGAIDFLPKQLNDIDGNIEIAKEMLRYRVRIIAGQARKSKRTKTKSITNNILSANMPDRQYTSHWMNPKADSRRPVHPDLLMIAASTGGPVAIQKVLSQIPANCSIPILLLQHMPANFTKSFAERLDQHCDITVKQADNTDFLQAGVALLCPGGMQLTVSNKLGRMRVNLRRKSSREIYSPCIDITFSSVAACCRNNILTLVLTGMGADGKEGVKQLKQQGAEVWAQDEASSTIYGMPKAIVDAHLADRIVSLDEIVEEFRGLN